MIRQQALQTIKGGDRRMDMIMELIKENFVFIVILIVGLVLIRVIAQKLFSIIGAIFVCALVFYAFTGDATFLNKTVDASTEAVDKVKSEVTTAEFKRTSDTTFILKTSTLTVEGDEETRIAKVKMGEKTVEVPLKNIYNALDDVTKKKINME